ncbi:hypothetical protein BGZ80_002310 [Entomortierella chlamydospora]|uniref:HMG box domain-containing protein n=1 Tax=Entomortierella chlamydospora TaxID=101097 RepID=A0A9P6MQI4_9FUNG|nr:hypothetical protein BGZ80_002310 [Entomortierella chlamydospora]
MKPIRFIHERAPNMPCPKPHLGTDTPAQPATQQRARRRRNGGKIKRSDNCFIIYRTHMHPYIVARHGNLNIQMISKIAGVLWESAPEHVKDIYRQKAYTASLLRKETLTRAVISEKEDASSISSNEAATVSDIQLLPNSDDAAHSAGPAAASNQNSGSECGPVLNGGNEKFLNGTRASISTSKTSIRKSTRSRSPILSEAALPNDTRNSDITTCNLIPSLSSEKADVPPFRCVVPEDYSTMPSVELPKMFTFVLQDPSTTIPHRNYVQSPVISRMTIDPFAGMAPPNHSFPIPTPLLSSPESIDPQVAPMKDNGIALAWSGRHGEAAALTFPHSPVNIEQSSVLKPRSAVEYASRRSPSDLVVQNASPEVSPAQNQQKPQSRRKYLCSDRQQERQQMQLLPKLRSNSFASALPHSDSFDQRFTDRGAGSEPFLALNNINSNLAELATAGKKSPQPLPTISMTPTLLSMVPNPSATTIQAMQVPRTSIEYPYTTRAPLAMTAYEYEWSTSVRLQQMYTPMECVPTGSKPFRQQDPGIATPLTRGVAPLMPSKNDNEYFDLMPGYSPASALPSSQTLNGFGNSNLAIGTPNQYPPMVAPAANVPSLSPSYSYQLQQQQLQQLYSVLENDDEEHSCERLRLSIEYHEKLLELQTWQLEQAQQQQQLFASRIV